MRKFSAHRIYPVSSAPINFGIIETDDEGTILKVRNTGGKPVEEAGLEFYSGIIIPGMVNAHCHLELSHLEGRIPPLTGITGFVSEVRKIRISDPDIITRAAQVADRRMYQEGISAAGDISNTGISLSIKQTSNIKYHTFIEVFGLDSITAGIRFEQALLTAGAFEEAGQSHSLAPHAPYSMSVELWERLSRENRLNRLISIHHDESHQERELLEHRSGVLAKDFRNAGFDLSSLPADAHDVFKLLGRYLPDSDCLLVHNTITDPSRPQYPHRKGLFWVLCPGSNLYIDNQLPDIPGFAASGRSICLGTDSLASNRNLSVLGEMKIVAEAAPGIPFDQILEWATLNGARALGMEKKLGSIEPGKNPGLVNIPDFDWSNDRLSAESKSIRLV